MVNKVQKTIDIIFNGIDNVSGVIGDIGDSLDSAGSNVSDFASPFESATAAVLALDAAMAALVVTGVMVSANIESEAVKMKNALGLPTEEAEKFKKIATDVYSQGYGDDLADSFEAVTLAQHKFGDSAEVDIGRAVLAAAKLEKTFGVDYNESLGAAKTLMTNFGLTADEAFDFVASGYQKGLDGSGDFIESINEYSTQFANGGSSAGQFFSVMESGFQEGTLGTDRAADAFKEFRVRIQDGSATTADALAQIGLGDEFTESLARGEISAIDAFGTVMQKLNEVDDSSIQMQAGVGLIGTQFEDLGTEAALALNTTQTQMADLIGTMDKFDGETFNKNMIAAWRTALVSVGELPIWEDIQKKIGELAGDISINFADSLENMDTSGIEVKAEELFNIFAKFFEDAELDLSTAEGMDDAIKMIIDSIESLIDGTKGMAEIAVPVFEAVVSAIEGFNDLDADTKELVGNIIALGTALGTVGTALTVGGALLSGLSSLGTAVSVGGAIATGIVGMIAILTGPVGFVLALAAAGVALEGYYAFESKKFNDARIKELEDQTKAINGLTEQIKELPIGVNTIEIFTAIESGDLEEAQNILDEISTDLHLIELGVEVDKRPLADYMAEVSDIFVSVGAKIDKESVETVEYTIVNEITGKEHTIKVPVEPTGLDKVKKDIGEIPTEKQIEISLQGDIDAQIAQIKATAETAEAAFKYTAEVDIAQAQAAAEATKSAFDNVGASVTALADSTSSMFGDLLAGWSELSGFDQNVFFREFEKQQELEAAALESQIKLNNAQFAHMEAQTEALERGDAAITIDSTGLEPALEMVMWEIIKKVQIRANEVAADMLLT